MSISKLCIFNKKIGDAYISDEFLLDHNGAVSAQHTVCCTSITM